MTTCFALESSAIQPIPLTPKLDPQKVTLGKELYSDSLFSQDNSLSCASCHSLKKGGTDNLPKYIGKGKKEGLLNTPTVLNASLNFRQFWDGRAKTLAEVIDDHISDKTIFDSQWSQIVERIKMRESYKAAFDHLYENTISPANIKDALVTYLDTLLTHQSPYDLFLGGKTSALTADAQKGYLLFKQYGCVTCHQGPNMGGNLILRFGIYKDFFATRTNPTKADVGYFNVTKNPINMHEFKVPSLRNIALTAPYLHDGSAKTLEEVIKLMGVYQVGQPIPAYEIPYIVKFLESLTGGLPENTVTRR